MREIKFRVWDDKGKYFRRADIIGPKNSAWGVKIDRGIFTIPLSETLIPQQFTGLLDKNKTPIYEGDIVDYRYDGMSEFDKERYADLLVSPVYWDYERWRIKYSAASYAWHLMEVVGNVFENPNLLEKQSESLPSEIGPSLAKSTATPYPCSACRLWWSTDDNAGECCSDD